MTTLKLNCTKCNQVLPVESFGKKNDTTRGYRYWCKRCSALSTKDYCARTPKRPRKLVCKEKKSRWDANYRERHRDKIRQKNKNYYEENREAIALKSKLRYLNNSEEVKRKVIAYKKNNADKVNALSMKRYAGKMNARPKWLTSDELWMIEQAYVLAKLREEVVGGKWDVDHIVPLRGNRVCGLHVPWNLAVVPASINRSKGNKFNVD